MFFPRIHKQVFQITLLLVFLAGCASPKTISPQTPTLSPPPAQPEQPAAPSQPLQDPGQPKSGVSICSESDTSSLGVLRSTDQGATWETLGNACMKNLNIKPVDPTGFTLNGQVVLYFIDIISLGKNGPYSIYRTVSMDGVNFDTPQPVYTQTNGMVDPAALMLADGSVRLYITSDKEGIISAFSTNGLEFEREEGIRFEFIKGGMPGALLLTDGRTRIFLNGDKDDFQGIYSFISSDGLNFTSEPGLAIKGSAVDLEKGIHINDPSPLKLKNGNYLLLYESYPKAMLDQEDVEPWIFSESFLATSSDGYKWVTNPKKVGNSGTSCLVEMPDGTLFIYYVNQ